MTNEKKQFDLTGFEKNPDGTYSKKKTVDQPRDKKKDKTLMDYAVEYQNVYDNSQLKLHEYTTKSTIQREVKVTGHVQMIGQRIEVKPLSVNGAWQGRRFKTEKYKAYEQGVLSILHNKELPPPPYRLSLIWGVRNKASDLDNPAKLFIDILQKRYNFNDKEIFELYVKKVIVPKRKEFCEFKLETLK